MRTPAAATERTTSGMDGSRFVGRESEMGVLFADLTAAQGGDGQCVILVGEPGIGKTRTATVLAAEARDRGFAVLWGRCPDDEAAPVYWPWIQALGTYAGENPASSDIVTLLTLLRARGTIPGAEEAPGHARLELFDRIARALARAASDQPLLVAIDDLHWADIGSLALLEFVVRQVGAHPLFVLGTLRATEVEQRPARQRLLSAIVRLGRNVALTGLARPAVRDLVSERLGHVPAEALVEEVLGLTEGNPFFVIEVTHLLAAAPEGRPPNQGVPRVPPGVHELLRERLAPLSPRALRLLQIASVLGREFDLEPLATVAGESPETVLEGLAAPLALSLVREVPGALRRYGFAHALLREALYAGLATGALAALHRAVGEALEALEAANEGHLSALAHHFFHAAKAGDATKAIRYGCEAGERALELLAFEEGIRHFERALAAIAVVGDDAARLRALMGLGDAVRGAGDPVRSEAAFRDALTVAERLGPHALAEAALRFATGRAEASVLDVEVNELLERALARLGPETSPLGARLMARLAAGLAFQPGVEIRRRELADEAIRIARRLDDPATLDYVLTRRLLVLLGPDDLEERVTATAELLGSSSRSRATQLTALIFRIDDLGERGDRVGLDHALAVFEQTVRGFQHPYFLWTWMSFRAAIAIVEGRFAEAESLATEALSLGQQVLTRSPPMRFGQQWFMLRGWQGRLSEVETLLERGVAESAVVPAWRSALANFYSLCGRTAEARREFEALAADDFATLPRDMNWLLVMSLLSAVCVRLGDVRRAQILYALLRPYAGRVVVARPLVLLIEPVAQRLGTLAAVLGRYDAAEAHFADALALAERMRGLVWQADLRHDWAAMLHRRGEGDDRNRGAALLDEAEAIARPLGMGLLLQWIAKTRETMRAVPPSATVAGPPPGPRGTFHRDGGIWTLVFENRTTRVRDMLGMDYLARLLAEPETDVHVTDLVARAHHRRRDAASGDRVPGDAGELLDARARTDYEARLRDARDELADARQHNDRGRIERLVDEIECLASELSRGFGLGARPRRAASANERARVAVTRAIKYSIDKIAEHDPDLASHLRRSVRTGTFCIYAPPSTARVAWVL